MRISLQTARLAEIQGSLWRDRFGVKSKTCVARNTPSGAGDLMNALVHSATLTINTRYVFSFRKKIR